MCVLSPQPGEVTAKSARGARGGHRSQPEPYVPSVKEVNVQPVLQNSILKSEAMAKVARAARAELPQWPGVESGQSGQVGRSKSCKRLSIGMTFTGLFTWST